MNSLASLSTQQFDCPTEQITLNVFKWHQVDVISQKLDEWL